MFFYLIIQTFLKIIFMKKNQLQQKHMEHRIKVKLDYKTTIIINKLSSLKIWKRRYPEAYIVS